MDDYKIVSINLYLYSFYIPFYIWYIRCQSYILYSLLDNWDIIYYHSYNNLWNILYNLYNHLNHRQNIPRGIQHMLEKHQTRQAQININYSYFHYHNLYNNLDIFDNHIQVLHFVLAHNIQMSILSNKLKFRTSNNLDRYMSNIGYFRRYNLYSMTSSVFQEDHHMFSIMDGKNHRYSERFYNTLIHKPHNQ